LTARRFQVVVIQVDARQAAEGTLLRPYKEDTLLDFKPHLVNPPSSFTPSFIAATAIPVNLPSTICAKTLYYQELEVYDVHQRSTCSQTLHVDAQR
jgi:hypothetical protein